MSVFTIRSVKNERFPLEISVPFKYMEKKTKQKMIQYWICIDFIQHKMSIFLE